MNLFLLISGIILLIVEAFIPMFGIIGLLGLSLVISALFLTLNVSMGFGALFGVSFFLAAVIGGGVYLVLKRYKDASAARQKALIGTIAQVLDWDGRQGRVEVNGKPYHAFSKEKYNFCNNDDVEIIGCEDLSLLVQPIKKA